jgi:hypothetical protein
MPGDACGNVVHAQGGLLSSAQAASVCTEGAARWSASTFALHIDAEGHLTAMAPAFPDEQSRGGNATPMTYERLLSV